MQIIIDIDARAYNKSLKLAGDEDGGILGMHLINAVANGTPLPKGHGRLIDVKDLLDIIGLEDNDSNREDNVGEIITLEDFDSIPTIIDADKAESEE